LVKYFDGNVQAGIFGIALAVMTAIYLIPSTVFQKYLLSKQHRWAVHDPRKFWLVYRRGNVVMLAAGIVLGGLVALLARWAVPLAFGEKYQAVVPVLMVLAWCVPIRFMSTGVGSALLSERHMRYRVFAMGLSALVVIVLNVLLIPAHHEIGAAIATVVGESVLLLALYGGVHRFHPPRERAS
jgi:O-antigen/teichoic acid export membrane protein